MCLNRGEKCGTKNWRQYHWGLSLACADLFESPQTSSGRPGKGPGARAESRHTSLYQHPGEAQNTHANKKNTPVSKSIFLKWERAPLVYTIQKRLDWSKCLQSSTCFYQPSKHHREDMAELQPIMTNALGAERALQFSLSELHY